MKLRFYIFLGLGFSLFCNTVSAQAPNTWKDWYAYNSVFCIESIDSSVAALTANGVFIYSTENETYKKITKLQGLSGVGLTTMKYNSQYKSLLIGYSDGCIDIIQFPKLTIHNIPTISKRNVYGSKAIRDIQFKNDTAYIATDFGLVTFHVQTHEFIHSAVLGSDGESIGVSQITIDSLHNTLYAASERGILRIGLHENISDGSLWQLVPNSIHQHSPITHICYYNNSLLYSVSHKSWEIQDTIYQLSNSISTLYDTLTFVEKIKHVSENVSIISRNAIKLYSSDNQHILSLPTASVAIQRNFSDICTVGNTYWISDYQNGIFKAQDVQSKYPQGPYSNNTAEVFCRKNVVHLVCGGANLYQIGQYNMLSGGFWYGHINWNVKNSICVYPLRNSDTYYYGTAGWGLVQGSKVWTYDSIYTKDNSTIQNMYNDNSPYEFITDIAADYQDNIWCINKSVQYPLVVKSNKQTWNKFYFSGVSDKNFERLVIDTRNTVWIAGTTKLIAFSAQNTIDNELDDLYAYIDLADEEGNIADRTTCLAIDTEDVLWIGTTQGIARHTNIQNVFKAQTSIARIKIEIDGEIGYLLSSERITCITVDGANRKWIGTQNSGVFLLSPDGTIQMANYTIQNSPIPSNTIQSIAINHALGEVYISTDKGLVSIMSDATIGADSMEDIKIFPNPVREDYEGGIYIQGTVANAIIKITDISGDLVFQTIANGGTGVWNGTNLKGERVATGVYLVYISSEDGTQTRVSKLLVVHK